MSTMGTFDAFTTARLGIYAAQHGFQVTGNNISNINTVGYTRQRVDQVSFKAGAYDRYRSDLDNHVGNGALVMSINQVRDPTLDVRYRNTNADYGYNNEMLDGLDKIASIIDEVGVGDDNNVNKKGDGRLHAQIQAVLEALREFSKSPTKDNNNLVRNAASTMCEILNSYARKLDSLKMETEQKFEDQLTEINECLTNIRDLNEEIRDNEIFGDNALELRDERNRQIDKLSEYLHIKVVYSEEDVGAGKKIEKLSIYLDNDNPDDEVHTDEALLIDGIFGAQLSSPEELLMANPKFDPATTADVSNAKRYIAEDGTVWGKDENGNDLVGDLTKATTIAYTNDPDKAFKLTNDYYGIQISELEDIRGNKWEGLHTAWEDITDELLAKYQFTIKNDLKQGDSFKIGDQSFIVRPNNPDEDYNPGDATEVSFATVQDQKAFAAFVAAELNKDKTAEYTASAKTVKNDTTQQDEIVIEFVAKKPLPVGTEGGPQDYPALEVTNDTAGKITIGSRKEISRGKTLEEYKKEVGDEGTKTNPNGTETITSYRPYDGKFWRVITHKEKTYPLTLDDNDPYGSLQATRELLTEAGEFTTNYVKNNIDENSTKKRGIPYYQLSLDLFARKFAEVYNGLNQGAAVDQDGNLLPLEEEVEIPELVKFQDPVSGEMQIWQVKDGVTPKPLPDPLPANFTAQQLTDAGYAVKPGWSVDGQDYCVDNVGGTKYYTGLHGENGQGCIIYHKIPIAEYDAAGNITNGDAVLAGLKQTGYDYSTCVTIENMTDPAKKAKEIGNLLKDCLAAHGVKMDGTPTRTVVTTRDDKLGGGPLFSNRNDRDSTGSGTEDDPYITAANITISHSWSNGNVQLVPKYEVLWDGSVDHSSQNTNADHMVTMLDKNNILLFNPQDIVPDAVAPKLFSGSFGDFFNYTCTALGEDARATNTALNMHYTQLIEIDTSRDGVSGVDLNDEAMNLMQFQKAYSAACRLMTAVDEVLDRLINNTGLAGR